MKRSYQRAHNQLRPLHISCNIAENADGSVLFEIGKTKVLCTVSLVGQVPLFLRGKSSWWLTGSYALLPASTTQRIERESFGKKNDRSTEISRLIGRSLRSIVDLTNQQSEKTIHIDCDVIQADGGTRAAAITGAFCALQLAQARWLERKVITRPFIMHEIAAISVGLIENQCLLDIDFAEDSIVQADFNFVLTRDGRVVEMQGSGEKSPIPWDIIMMMKDLADQGIQEIFSCIAQENIHTLFKTAYTDQDCTI
jgi:ribonuclease PH